jgi:cell division protein FtsB
MMRRIFRTGRPAFGPLVFFAVAFALSLYFTFAAVQGDYGIFRRAEIQAEARDLRVRLEQVRADVARMENLARRLSDDYLDIDLLDEQTRSVLGLIRADEIVIR